MTTAGASKPRDPNLEHVRKARPMEKTGVVQKIGLEGGLLALVTDTGETYELLDPPAALRPGVRAKVELDTRGADVSIGMVGQAARVRSYTVIP